MDSNPQANRWWAATAVLLVVAAGLLALGTLGHDDPTTSTAATQHASPLAQPVTALAPEAVSPVEGRSAPVELRIPAIGVSVSVSALGLQPDDTVEVPTDFQEPGWFQLGPSPGHLGSAVILGHVDSSRGPAVFFRLRTLVAGDDVEVTMADGSTAHFAVTSVETYPKAQFPAQRVYATQGSSSLQLVTCGGEFDRNTGSYRSNVVAYTSLVAIDPAVPSGPGAPEPAGQG